MSSLDYIREHVWIVPLGVMIFFIVLKLLRQTTKWDQARTDIVSYKDPDNLPDLSKTIWRTRIQIILAAFSIIAFTIIAIVNSL